MKGALWYEEGRLLQKKNTFTDFISVANYFISNRFTTSNKLAVWGRSAGGECTNSD